MMFLFDTAVRVSVILLLALAAVAAMPRASAAVRHWVLAFAVLCAALVPVLELTLPSWQVGVPSLARAGEIDSTDTAVSTSFSTAIPQPAASVRTSQAEGRRALRRTPPVTAAIAVWATGACVSLSALLVGFAHLRRVRATARRQDRGVWVDAIARACPSRRLRRSITVWLTDHPSLLLTWGHVRPQLFVPAASIDWPADRISVVVGHEVAHIVRGDWLAQLCAELLCAVHWFNPVVWIVCRRLRQESERACDDAVLNAGVEPAEYASQLVALAGTLRGARASRPALAMARPSTLEGRVRAMLNAHINRRPIGARARLGVAAALAALTIPIAVVAQNRFASFSGSIVDQTNRVVPDVTLTLTNPSTKAKYEVHSDRAGHFEFVGLTAGEYSLDVVQPGFEPLADTVRIAGSDVTRTIQLALGHLQETITMTAGAPPKPDPAREQKIIAGRASGEQRLRKIRERCASGDQPGDIGGNIAPPLKLVDVKPVYPEQLKAAKIGGLVKLDALIGTDGTVRDVKPMGDGNPDLERAAMDAVRQWQFTPTFLNCTAVEVRMQVSANFVGDR